MENNLVEPRLSSYLHAKAAMKGTPITGTFELTARCNLSCRMCYVHMSAAEERAIGRELTTDEWLRIAADARERGMLFLLITGGEPLVRSDFKELFCELKKMGFMISINSNATLINDEWLEFFKKEPPFRFNISLYGAENEAYERLCGAPHGSKMCDRVKSNIRALKEMGIGVKLNLSLTPYNRGEMAGVWETARELGMPIQSATYMFPPMRRDGSCIGCGDRFTPDEDAACGVEWDKLRFDAETFRARAKALVRGCQLPDDADCGGSPDRGVRCRAGRSTFWINWRGEMTPCGMMTEPAVSVIDEGFGSAWEKIKAETAKIQMPIECSGCKMRHACHVCAASCYCETGRFDGKPEYICASTAKMLEILEREVDQNGDNNGN